jgi:cold-inducible RNA-binding protein
VTKLYVGNLPYKITSEDLKQMFSAYGEVTATVIMDKMSGRSKGFGFVELDDAVSEQVISEMNGKDMEGRALVVNIARPMEDRPKRPFDNNRGGGRPGGSFSRDRY